MASVGGFGRVLGIHVQVLQQAGLRERRLVVDPRAAVSMAARSDLEVERAVDPRKKNTTQQSSTHFYGAASTHLAVTNSTRKAATYLSFSVPKIEARYSAIVSH